MSQNIEITIPSFLTSDFLGSMVLDILHDGKGRGILKDRKLCVFTDLLSDCFELSNLKNWVFLQVFNFFCKLWKDNISALGIDSLSPNYTVDYYRKNVSIPVKASGLQSDCFCSLGPNKKTPEFENYQIQKQGLEYKDFISPLLPEKFYENSKRIVNSILRISPNALVSLDMKTSAGLIRSITDPIGYVSSIATYSDPGYNMAGMSSIRNRSVLIFKEKNNFTFTINLEIEDSSHHFFTTEYYWAESKDLREHLIIKINDYFFHRSLPKSREMAESIQKYLDSENIVTVWSAKENIESIYKKLSDENIVENEYSDIYRKFHKGIFKNSDLKNIVGKFNIQVLNRWISDNPVNLAYIVSSLRLYKIYNIKTRYIKPEDIITKVLPYYLSKNVGKNLAYINAHIDLLLQYIGHPDQLFIDQRYKYKLRELLDSQRVGENSRNKIINLREKLIKNLYSSFKEKLISKNVDAILKNIIDNPETDIILNSDIENILKTHIKFYIPENNNVSILKLSLLDICLKLDIIPEHETEVLEDSRSEALKYMLGKFNGDFGQIIWCIATENIFATEDNNSSALACLMRKISLNSRWCSIHGLGDGGSVEIF